MMILIHISISISIKFIHLLPRSWAMNWAFLRKLNQQHQKYLKHHINITGFFNNFINTDEFKAILPHSGKWLTIDQQHEFRTSKGSNLMVYKSAVQMGCIFCLIIIFK